MLFTARFTIDFVDGEKRITQKVMEWEEKKAVYFAKAVARQIQTLQAQHPNIEFKISKVVWEDNSTEINPKRIEGIQRLVIGMVEPYLKKDMPGGEVEEMVDGVPIKEAGEVHNHAGTFPTGDAEAIQKKNRSEKYCDACDAIHAVGQPCAGTVDSGKYAQGTNITINGEQGYVISDDDGVVRVQFKGRILSLNRGEIKNGTAVIKEGATIKLGIMDKDKLVGTKSISVSSLADMDQSIQKVIKAARKKFALDEVGLKVLLVDNDDGSSTTNGYELNAITSLVNSIVKVKPEEEPEEKPKEEKPKEEKPKEEPKPEEKPKEEKPKEEKPKEEPEPEPEPADDEDEEEDKDEEPTNESVDTMAVAKLISSLDHIREAAATTEEEIRSMIKLARKSNLKKAAEWAERRLAKDLS